MSNAHRHVPDDPRRRPLPTASSSFSISSTSDAASYSNSNSKSPPPSSLENQSSPPSYPEASAFPPLGNLPNGAHHYPADKFWTPLRSSASHTGMTASRPSTPSQKERANAPPSGATSHNTDMAAPLITRPQDSLASAPHQQSHPLSGPFDIFVYGKDPDSPEPMSRQLPQRTRRPHLSDHIIALPPFTSPSDSPGQPSTPYANTVSDPLSSEARDSQERMAYRSWREGKPVLGGRVVRAADDGSPADQEEHIDKKIEATLPRADQNVNARSRKTSHHMRIFNQAEESHQEAKPLPPVEELYSDFASEHSQDEIENDLRDEKVSEVPLRSDGRRRSTSKPSPTLQDDRTQRREEKRRDTVTLLEQPVHSSTDSNAVTTRLREDGKPRARRQSQLTKSTEEEHEVSEEQITSAIYYPHRALGQQKHVENESTFEGQASAHADSNFMKKPDAAKLSPPAKSQDPRVGAIEFAIQSEDENHLFHGAVPLHTRGERLIEQKMPMMPPIEPHSISASESESESVQSHDEGDLGTMTPRPGASAASRHSRSDTHVKPPQAIMLKPFVHQVGGHSRVYRFSRKAICKELNNKENKFYETVERYHPEMLDFLPRYIGVLNATYEKTTKRKKSSNHSSDRDTTSHQISQAVVQGTGTDLSARGTGDSEMRLVSHSQIEQPTPEVRYDLNRHIIPFNFFPPGPSGIPAYGYSSTLSDGLKDVSRRESLSTSPLQERPKHSPPTRADIWGTTFVNEDFRMAVMREAFAPPPIHRHRKRGTSHDTRMRANLDRRKMGLSEAQPDTNRGQGPRDDGTSLKEQLMSDRLRIPENPTISKLHGQENHLLSRSASQGFDKSEIHSLDEASTPSNDNKRIMRRRHSGSGLRRMASNVDSDRGDLQYFEELDYGADIEDEVFHMESDPVKGAIEATVNGRQTSGSGTGETHQNTHPKDMPPQSNIVPSPHSAPISFSTVDGIPSNPKEARLQAQKRVTEYLVLEDLTSAFAKPCTLDLKMGTRQYGLDADEKKQQSQQRKCKATTSHELGTRVCGMQTYDIKSRKYNFKDKYYGRSLRAGDEFRQALKSFFHDGVDYHAARIYIPKILAKLAQFERIVRSLPGYRFYGSSLYIIYESHASDGKHEDTRDGTSEHSHPDHPERHEQHAASPTSEVNGHFVFKIIDFANCVTAESTSLLGVACPPAKPEGVDTGYLRGLRSLRMYFQKVWEDMYGSLGDLQQPEQDSTPILQLATDESEDSGSVSCGDDLLGDVSV